MLVLNRARTWAATAALIFVLMAAGLTFAVPAQASDMSGPVLLNPSVTSTNLNLYEGPATINVSLRLVDETGVRTPTLIASWVNADPCWWCGGGGQSQGFGSMTLSSGTMQDGIWKKTITVPQGAAAGNWDIKLYPLEDTWGNNSSFFKTLATVTVIDEAPRIPVTPTPVRFSDQDGTAKDAYSVPDTKGVEYVVNGIVVAAGTYPGKGTVTVTARAGAGYVLAPNAKSSWTATFKGVLAGSTPTITGTARVGSTLTAKHGTWSPAPVNLSYQWYRSGVTITGATVSTYKLTASDFGKTITVRTTARKTAYKAVSKTSRPTAAVATNLLTATRPVIVGTAIVGRTLTVKTGIWSPTGVTFTYQWNRNGSPIPGATANSYKAVAADLGSALSIKVTGSKSGYLVKAATSSPSSRVIK